MPGQTAAHTGSNRWKGAICLVLSIDGMSARVVTREPGTDGLVERIFSVDCLAALPSCRVEKGHG